MTTDPLIEVSQLRKVCRSGDTEIQVLRGVELTVRRGEMVAVMGASGSGKSTLLFILGLFLAPTQGAYRALGRDVLSLDRSAQAQFRRTSVGFVFQSCNLVESSTVYENLELPLIYAGTRRAERRQRILEALDRVNMGHRVHHRAGLLSGGEQQRVAVARALMNSPQIVLADEPTGQLDRENTRAVMEYSQQCIADGERAMIVVTHNAEVAAQCTRTCRLRDGVIVA